MTRISEMDRKRAQRAAATAREEQRRAEHFAATTASLVAALPERLSRARERSRIALDLTIGAQAITVRRPASLPERMDGHRLVISRPDRSGTTVEVVLIFDTRVGGEVPSGEESPVLSVRSSTEALLAGDFDILLEWLVCCTDRDHPAAPEIAGLFEQRREEEREREGEEALQRKKTRLMIAGHTGILLLVLGLVLWILAPVGFGIGMWSRNRLEELNSTAGLWSSGCFVLFAGALTVAVSLSGLWLILHFVRL